jgi:hypothetical protein
MEQRPAQAVRPGLADDADLVRAEAVLGRVGGGLLLELLDRVHRQDRGRRTKRGIRIRRAIEQVVVRRGPRSVDADRVARALPHGALFALRLDGTVAEEQQLEEVAAVQRQLGDLPLGDDVADAGGLGVERNRPPDHLHAFGECTELHDHVDAKHLVDLELVGGRDSELEAVLLRRDHVGADRELRHRVGAPVAARGLTSQARQRVGDFDANPGDGCPRRVSDRPGDLPGCRLGGGRKRRSHEQHQNRGDGHHCCLHRGTSSANGKTSAFPRRSCTSWNRCRDQFLGGWRRFRITEQRIAPPPRTTAQMPRSPSKLSKSAPFAG